MSRQLAISSAFSIVAMVAFALSSPGNANAPYGAAGMGDGVQVSSVGLASGFRVLPSQR